MADTNRSIFMLNRKMLELMEILVNLGFLFPFNRFIFCCFYSL